MIGATRAKVLPTLAYGRARIVEAKIDQARGVVGRLNDDDVAWLRANDATFASNLTKFAAQLQMLAATIAPADQVAREKANGQHHRHGRVS
jgi:hypothetical protein